MKKFAAVIAVLFAVVALASCSSTPKTAPPAAAQPAAEKQAAPVPEQPAPPAKTDANALAGQLRALEGKSVYFDFDKSAIKPEYGDVIQQQADFIKAHGNDTVTIQGNCDERGSAKYNLALGERRADAVRKELEALGVPASQLKTVSFGKGKPRLTCHSEKCWKENRRADFVHKLD